MLPRVMVAPNGARHQKSDHPAVPLTTAEMVETAVACLAAGAHGLHLHVRDAKGQHLLDAGAYREAAAAIRAAAPGLAVQITTEGAGRYDPDAQMDVALSSGVPLVSASIRELCRGPIRQVQTFLADCQSRGISVQHIVYDTADLTLLETVLSDDALRDPALQLLYVLGRYGAVPSPEADPLSDFAAWRRRIGVKPDWAVCAFGRNETRHLIAAAGQGGKMRVGFENSFHLSDGRIADNNAEKVRDLIRCLSKASLAPANATLL